MNRTRTLLADLSLACASLTLAAVSPAICAAPPKAVEAVTAQGFSPERLKRLDAAIDEQIAQQQLAGGVMARAA
ncbi:hypothetical protein [Roseateles sp.]|uniref:hypothetical protein n=1 Tax=Roseateles sp. TaxID=1971397 RepID=UPI0032638059